MSIAIFDTETSDMLKFNLAADAPGQARIVQIGVILADMEFNPIREYEAIIKPDGWTVQTGAFNVHGISTEHALAYGRPAAEVLPEVDAIMLEARAIGAFNIRFDNKFLRGERRRLGRPDLFGHWPEVDAMHISTPVCQIPPTVKMIKAGRKNFKTPNLGEAFSMLTGNPFEKAHNALEDCRATLAVLRALKARGVAIVAKRPESIKGEDRQAAKELAAEEAVKRTPIPQSAEDDFF